MQQPKIENKLTSKNKQKDNGKQVFVVLLKTVEVQKAKLEKAVGIDKKIFPSVYIHGTI